MTTEPIPCDNGSRCDALATGYAIDPRPGGWGGRYCAACTEAMGFMVVDPFEVSHDVLH